MDNVNEILPQLAAYHTALLALAILCLAVLVQSVIAGAIGLGKSDEEPGLPLKGNHKNFSFRTLRTYGNSVENLPAFAIVLFLAIIAGVTPSWVNWLAGINVALRLLYWAIYYSGVGKVANGPRTIVYASGWFANLILAGATLQALLR